MKTQLKDSLELQSLLEAVKKDTSQFDREFYSYMDELHRKIRTMESTLELINDQSKKYL